MTSRSDLYPLQPFRVHDRDTLLEIVRAYPLATLFSGDGGRGDVTLVPMLAAPTREHVRLIGHVDGNNPHADRLKVGQGVSFVFQGPNAYASPDLYREPQLPGWLYVAVKGRGEVVAEHTAEQARAVLIDASRRFGGAGQQFELRDEDPRIDRFIHGIVAFEIHVRDMSGIAKLAQDKGPASARLAAEHLASRRADSMPLFTRLLRETLGGEASPVADEAAPEP